MKFRNGMILGENRYRVIGGLGCGGQAVVLHVIRLLDGRDMALKVLTDPSGLQGDSSSSSLAPRFFREAALMSALRHPGIAICYESGDLIVDGETVPYMALEYIPGCTLEAEIVLRCERENLLFLYSNEGTERKKGTERKRRLFAPTENDRRLKSPLFSLLDVIYIIQIALEALAYMHCFSGHVGDEELHAIHHRDVKPANIMVQRNSTGQAVRVALLDFGIVRISSGIAELLGATRTLTGTRALIGSPSFMSPEQIKEPSTVGAQTDIFSIGLICFLMLTGRHPYKDAKTVWDYLEKIKDSQPDDPRLYAAGVPDRMAEIVTKAMARDSNDRFADAGEMLAAWNEMTSQLLDRGATTLPLPPPVSLAHAATVEATRRPISLRQAWGWAPIAVLVGAFVLFFVLFGGRSHQNQKDKEPTIAVQIVKKKSAVPSAKSDVTAPSPRIVEQPDATTNSMLLMTLETVRLLCLQARQMKKMHSPRVENVLADVRKYKAFESVPECRGL